MKNKKPRPAPLRNLKWFTLMLSIACVVFIYFIPRSITYADYAIIRWIPPALIFLVLPVLLFVTSLLFTWKVTLSTGITAVVVIIVGPTFGWLQDYRETNELKKYGVWTNAIVIEKKRMGKTGTSGWDWKIKCKYDADKKSYETLYHNDLNNMHPVGDTVRLIYSSQFPKIYALGYEWGK